MNDILQYTMETYIHIIFANPFAILYYTCTYSLSSALLGNTGITCTQSHAHLLVKKTMNIETHPQFLTNQIHDGLIAAF